LLSFIRKFGPKLSLSQNRPQEKDFQRRGTTAPRPRCRTTRRRRTAAQNVRTSVGTGTSPLLATWARVRWTPVRPGSSRGPIRPSSSTTGRFVFGEIASKATNPSDTSFRKRGTTGSASTRIRCTVSKLENGEIFERLSQKDAIFNFLIFINNIYFSKTYCLVCFKRYKLSLFTRNLIFTLIKIN
jgi:hypothetical protein